MNIKITRKKIKNLILRVTADGEVSVSAPYRVPVPYIEEFVHSKKEWIEKKMKMLREKKDNKELKFEDGEKFLYLGNTYQIKIFNSDKDFCVFQNNFLLLNSSSNEIQHKKEIVTKFIWNSLFEVLYDLNKQIGNKIGHLPVKIRLRDMKTRWGSCNSYKKTITYNFRLYTKPIEAIEYVVLHELAHIPYPHHQKDFWNFVEKYMPDFKKRKQILKKI